MKNYTFKVVPTASEHMNKAPIFPPPPQPSQASPYKSPVQKSEFATPSSSFAEPEYYPKYPCPPEEPEKPDMKFRLAHAYVPWQYYNVIYSPQEALQKGTVFPELDMPKGTYSQEGEYYGC